MCNLPAENSSLAGDDLQFVLKKLRPMQVSETLLLSGVINNLSGGTYREPRLHANPEKDECSETVKSDYCADPVEPQKHHPIVVMEQASNLC